MSTQKRDELLAIQAETQKVWDDTAAFEVDAPAGEGLAKADETYMVTIPYPYMNGKLHLGHAFTITKCEFAAGYQRLRGKKSFFPFGFHCTGMPIKAAADKLKREMELYGTPPVFPSAAPDEDSQGKKVHAKIEAKTGNEKYQWNILVQLGVPEEEIPCFADEETWLKYFPPKGIEHLKQFGCKVDWRRAFITTSANPFYDSFVRWQFEHLREKNKIKFGKRYTIYSPRDGQPCMDHDRSKGENVGPFDYTLIKLEVLAPLPPSIAAIEGIADRKVYFVAATMRPETMYGQTNCWVSPTIEYVAIAINETEIFVCTRRAALNIAYQPYQPDSGLGVQGNTRPEGTCDIVAQVPGGELIGCRLSAPLAEYPVVYALPLLTISAAKGTGIVTSVPSDSPDDYAGLRDLKNKKALRAKYGITDEMVLPFDPVPIIDIPGFSSMSAEKACDDLKVASQNDAAKLAEAKDMCYQKGFSEGIMLKGTFAGEAVKVAKDKCRDELVAAGMAVLYKEPEKLVMSRSDEECVVALCDQWFITYGEPEWREQVEKYVNGSFECFDPATKKRFNESLDWLHEHACSRLYGLGTKLPWDEEWVIESLSDSTIYMAYYTVSHLLQGGVLDGTGGGPLGILPEHLTREVWDHIFLGTAVGPDCAIPAENLAVLRNEFLYFYPMDLRVTGKDLIPNHLTYSLYNHCAIFPPELWPKAFRANGLLMLNHNKMSKSTGNFLTLEDAVGLYTADITRLICADAGDSLEDANFEEKAANAQLIKMHAELDWINSVLKAAPSFRDGPITEFADRAFSTCIDHAIHAAADAYDKMNFREALKVGYFELQAARDTYREMVRLSDVGPHRDVIMRYISVQYLLLAPVCPHICEHVWKLLGNEGTMMIDGRWPAAAEVDTTLLKAFRYLDKTVRTFRLRINTVKSKKQKGGKATAVAKATIYVASEYPEWQQVVLSKLNDLFDPATGTFVDNREVLAALEGHDALSKVMKKVMPFVQFVREQVNLNGRDALSQVMPFDEFEVLNANLNYLRKTLEIDEICVLPVSSATDAKIVNDCIPGNPFSQFTTTSVDLPPATASKSKVIKSKKSQPPPATTGPEPSTETSSAARIPRSEAAAGPAKAAVDAPVPSSPPSESGPTATINTERVYYKDTRVLHLDDVTVLAVEQADTDAAGNRLLKIATDKTIFHPQGGGQPSDVGTMTMQSGRTFTVLRVDRNRDVVVGGPIWHTGTLDGDGSAIKVGDQLTQSVDAEPRQLHARLHSAGHMLEAVVNQMPGYNLAVAAGDHTPNGPYLRFSGVVPSDQLPEFKQRIQDQVDKLVAANAETINTEVDPAEIAGRFKVPPGQPTVRVVGVAGRDPCPCGGTHVTTAGEIGRLVISDVKSKASKKTTTVKYTVA